MRALPRRIPHPSEEQWQAGRSHGVYGGRSMPWEADHDLNANGRFDMLSGAFSPQRGDASRQRPHGVQRSQKKSYVSHSQRHPRSTLRAPPVAQEKATKRLTSGHYVLSQHRPPTSAQSLRSPTTSSPSLLSFERSLHYPSYRPPKHPKWRGRQSSSTAS